ncbi:MAG: TonB family protein [Flavobacteriia bacterium]|jgi:TonB family protein
MKILYIISLTFSLNLFSQTACIQYDSNFTGFCSEFHSNGKTKWIKEFQEGQAVGIWMNFDEKGNLVKQLNTSLKRDSLQSKYKFEDVVGLPWSDDKLVNGIGCRDVGDFIWTNCGEARFAGTADEMNKFLTENLVYPPDAIDLGLQGKCYLKFIVEVDGTITHVSVVKGVPDCPQCDKEAIRVVKMMPPWLPETIQGQKVRSWGQLPLNFTLH